MEADNLQASPVFGRCLSNMQHLILMYNRILGMQCAAQAAAQEAEQLQQREEALQQEISRVEEQLAHTAQASTKLEETKQVCQSYMLNKLRGHVSRWGASSCCKARVSS